MTIDREGKRKEKENEKKFQTNPDVADDVLYHVIGLTNETLAKCAFDSCI